MKSNFRRAATGIMSYLFLASSGLVYAEALPKALIGKWEVQEVHINTSSGRTVQYQWNDPRLRYRIFDFQSDAVAHNAYEFEDACHNPSGTYAEMAFEDLIFRSIGGYGSQTERLTNPAQDYQLRIDPKKSMKVITILCSNKIWQEDLGISSNDSKITPISGAWITLVSGDKLYLRWRNEVILVLRRIGANEAISTSFDCAKASGKTELAICDSRELAGFDRSVSQAYKQHLNNAKNLGLSDTNIARDQRLWIRKRSVCQADEKCIITFMRSRLESLVGQSIN